MPAKPTPGGATNRSLAALRSLLIQESYFRPAQCQNSLISVRNVLGGVFKLGVALGVGDIKRGL